MKAERCIIVPCALITALVVLATSGCARMQQRREERHAEAAAEP